MGPMAKDTDTDIIRKVADELERRKIPLWSGAHPIWQQRTGHIAIIVLAVVPLVNALLASNLSWDEAYKPAIIAIVSAVSVKGVDLLFGCKKHRHD